MGTELSGSMFGNSMPLFLSSWYTSTTPFKSGCDANVSAQIWIKLKTFSCTAVGGSYFGPISFTSSWMNSLLATKTWKFRPQFFTHVSNTVSVSLRRNAIRFSSSCFSRHFRLLTKLRCNFCRYIVSNVCGSLSSHLYCLCRPMTHWSCRRFPYLKPNLPIPNSDQLLVLLMLFLLEKRILLCY